MPVVADSYMGVFMPADISARITRFLTGEATFPLIEKDEIIGAFFIFGKDYGVPESEVKEAKDIARRTVEQAAKDARMYASMPGRLDPAFTRENYTKRMLQIAVDTKNSNVGQDEINRRVAGDPAILSDCFAQHVAHYRHDYYFEIFGPLQREQVPFQLRKKLQGRMLLLGYSVKNAKALPFASSLEPFFAWLSKV